MDSKLFKITALLSLATVLLISLIVVGINRGGTKRSGGQTVSTEKPQTSQGSSVQTQGLPDQIGTDLKAFERDSTFFDPEENSFLEGLMDRSNRLSLSVTSVERDLRIQVLDWQERTLKGENLAVALEGVGEFQDLDQDGIIYIGDLDPGEYYVSLCPIKGYRIPENSTRIRVKEKVEYLPIEDIALLIRTEDAIDPRAEDTGDQGARWDTDDTEMTKLQAGSKTAKVGIDVSKWQGDIAWDRVKKAGVEFAVIRAGYRGSSTGALVEDPSFRENMRGAYGAGIPAGVYFFSQAVNEVEAVEEASAVLQLVKNFHVEYPIFIDTEDAGGSGRADGLDAQTRTQVCEAFCKTVRNAGYTAGIYGGRKRYQDDLDVSRLDKYVIWLAEYRKTPQYEGYYEMWQHTSQGVIDGILGNVNLNISYWQRPLKSAAEDGKTDGKRG